MPEPKKRIIVEGVDFPQIFQFPRLLRAATAALQPARLVIGLLIVTALITFGQIWDGVAGPSVAPDGLAAGPWNEQTHGEIHQARLRNALVNYTESSMPPGNEELQTDDVLKRMDDEYKDRRAKQPTPEAQEIYTQGYVQAVRDIEASRPRGVFEAAEAHVVRAFTRNTMREFLYFDFPGALAGLQQLFIETPQLLWRNYKWFTVMYGLFTIFVFAICGGAIARMSASQQAIQRRLGVREAIDFSLRHLGSFVTAQALPFIILLLLCGTIIVMGVLMAAPVLDVVGALLYGLALILGFLIAFLLIGLLLGHPLLVPAVACENCSGPDAMQRAYAYTVTRPLHLIGYWLVALIGLTLGFLLVSVVAAIMLDSTAALYDTVSDHAALTAAGEQSAWELHRPRYEVPLGDWHTRWSAGIVGFWETVVVCLVAAYVFSYYFSASAIMYLLMRRAADGQDMSEIWQPGPMPGTTPPMSAAAVEAARSAPDAA